MNIGGAVCALKAGKRIARKGWNGKKMWLHLVRFDGTARVSCVSVEGGVWCRQADFVEMKTADNMLVPWLCSQTDLLAEDWEIVT